MIRENEDAEDKYYPPLEVAEAKIQLALLKYESIVAKQVMKEEAGL